jgi:hypothetical protein
MASKSVSGTPWSKPAWPWLRGGSVDPMEIEKSGENRLAQLRTRHLGKALEQPWWPVHKPRQRFVVKLLNSIPTHPYIIIPILLMISPTISWGEGPTTYCLCRFRISQWILGTSKITGSANLSLNYLTIVSPICSISVPFS